MLEFNIENLDLQIKKKSILSGNLEPISHGIFMVHVYAGCFQEGFVIVGCVIKNHSKEVIIASSKKEHIFVDSSVAEILSIRWSLKIPRELNLERVLIQ